MTAAGLPPEPLHDLAPGLGLARGGPGRTLNIYLLGDVVIDSGVRWSRRRLERQLAGRRIAAHVLTHAHFDHAGSSAWLCRAFGVPLWCGPGDAAAISSSRVDTHGSPLLNRLQRTVFPVAAHPVTRALHKGDVVGGFEVVEVPGHSPGALAFWRERDRVLVCGDVLANLGLRPDRVRLVLTPAALTLVVSVESPVTAAGLSRCLHAVPERPEPAERCSVPSRRRACTPSLRSRHGCGDRGGTRPLPTARSSHSCRASAAGRRTPLYRARR